MTAEPIIAPKAAQDMVEAYEWHEGHRIGLGGEFFSQGDACTQATVRNPKMHPVVHDNYRRALVRRFPYAVFYEYAAGVVTVYCVFHTSRDPEKWHRRPL